MAHPIGELSQEGKRVTIRYDRRGFVGARGPRVALRTKRACCRRRGPTVWLAQSTRNSREVVAWNMSTPDPTAHAW